MLSLAVVDYVKAQTAERDGNIEAKEYFMREFFNKLADNESNKNKAFVAQAVSPYAVKQEKTMADRIDYAISVTAIEDLSLIHI